MKKASPQARQLSAKNAEDVAVPAVSVDAAIAVEDVEVHMASAVHHGRVEASPLAASASGGTRTRMRKATAPSSPRPMSSIPRQRT